LQRCAADVRDIHAVKSGGLTPWKAEMLCSFLWRPRTTSAGHWIATGCTPRMKCLCSGACERKRRSKHRRNREVLEGFPRRYWRCIRRGDRGAFRVVQRIAQNPCKRTHRDAPCVFANAPNSRPPHYLQHRGRAGWMNIVKADAFANAGNRADTFHLWTASDTGAESVKSKGSAEPHGGGEGKAPLEALLKAGERQPARPPKVPFRRKSVRRYVFGAAR